MIESCSACITRKRLSATMNALVTDQIRCVGELFATIVASMPFYLLVHRSSVHIEIGDFVECFIAQVTPIVANPRMRAKMIAQFGGRFETQRTLVARKISLL